MEEKNVALATLKNNTVFSYSLILQSAVYCARSLPASGLLFVPFPSATARAMACDDGSISSFIL